MTATTPSPVSDAAVTDVARSAVDDLALRHDASPQPGDTEELQRAELYGLLARLWWAPVDAPLQAQFRVAVTTPPTEGGYLEGPWGDLVAALRAATLSEAIDEYEALFGGVGKPEIFVYASYHLAGYLNERPLALLRADLVPLGLTSDPDRGETEDHIAYLCEVMRFLIAGEDLAVSNLEQQRRFFRAHLQPWVGLLCDAVAAQPRARIYAALAALTRAFIDVETQAFDMLEAG